MATRIGRPEAGAAQERVEPKEGLGEWLALHRRLKPSVRANWFAAEDRIHRILYPHLPTMDEHGRWKKYPGQLQAIYEYLAEAINQLPEAELRRFIE